MAQMTTEFRQAVCALMERYSQARKVEDKEAIIKWMVASPWHDMAVSIFTISDSGLFSVYISPWSVPVPDAQFMRAFDATKVKAMATRTEALFKVPMSRLSGKWNIHLSGFPTWEVLEHLTADLEQRMDFIVGDIK